MHVFIWEALSAGALGQPDSSMRHEGHAMLAALIDDVLRIPGCRVATILSPMVASNTIVANDRLTVVRAANNGEELLAFQQFAGNSDRTWIIAPEIDGLLSERIALAKNNAASIVGPNHDAVQQCSDKLSLALQLQACGIATIPTWTVSAMPSALPYPRVVKPRFGAGSTRVRLVAARKSCPKLTGSNIMQPFLPGEPLSIAGIVKRRGATNVVFPLCVQDLSDDGRFQFLGGRVVPNHPRHSDAVRLFHRVCRSIDGLAGYVGIDLIAPLDPTAELVVVEVNPRLTTSYIGLRQSTRDNLARRILFPEYASAPPVWINEAVSFTPGGE